MKTNGMAGPVIPELIPSKLSGDNIRVVLDIDSKKQVTALIRSKEKFVEPHIYEYDKINLEEIVEDECRLGRLHAYGFREE